MRVVRTSVAIIALLALASWWDHADGQACSPACQNGGICQFYIQSGSSSCNCAGTGYSGASCSTLAGAPANSTSQPTTSNATSPPSTLNCSGEPCYHGVCQQEQDSSIYYCSCNSGYSGTFCNASSINVAPSTPATASTPSTSTTNQSCNVPCYNGQCVPQFNSALYECKCNSGYSGATCNVKTQAPAPTAVINQSCPITCYNGVCVPEFDSEGSYTCNCIAGYTGPTCNQKSTTAASPSGGNAGCSAGCYNGHCVSYSNGTSYCQCNSGFSGSTCSQRSTVSSSTENSKGSSGGSHLSGGAIFGIVVAAFAGAMVLALGGFLLWRRSRKETFVRFQDGQNPGEGNVEIGKQQMSSGSLGFRSSTSALMS